MIKKGKICTFEIEIQGKMERFSIYGKYTIETGKDDSLCDYKYLEFEDIVATKAVGMKEVFYEPTGVSWAGSKYDASDMCGAFISNLTFSSNQYTKVYIQPDLEEMVGEYLTDEIEVGNLSIPRRVLSCNMRAYTLLLATDSFLYYGDGEDLIMLATEDRRIVSDNYFAEVGFWQSVEAIETGEEKHLWGDLPE